MQPISIRGLISVFIAAALTLMLVIVIVLFQAITGDFEGGEAAVVWTITGVIGVLAASAWIPAAMTLRSADLKSADPSDLRRVIGVSLIAAILVVWWAL